MALFKEGKVIAPFVVRKLLAKSAFNAYVIYHSLSHKMRLQSSEYRLQNTIKRTQSLKYCLQIVV